MNGKVNCSAVCVLGVHRSGTSTVTRGLNLLGAFLGEGKDLMQPLPENPEGFWERLDVYYLHDRILAIMKRRWDSVSPLPENWMHSAEIRPLRHELAELVKKNFSERQLWAWKDPRTCLLLPLWKEVLAELGIGLKVVLLCETPSMWPGRWKKETDFPWTRDSASGLTIPFPRLKMLKVWKLFFCRMTVFWTTGKQN